MNLADLVRGAAEDFPAKEALLFHGRATSFAQLDELVDLTAGALSSLGVVKGDRVGLLIGNVPEFVTSFFGLLRAGAAACPLNTMLTAEEIGYILADAGARAVITELSSLTALLSVRDRLGDLETIIVVGGPPAPAGTVSLEEVLREAGEPPEVTTDRSDLAVIAYTAGTTADPKGAMLTHGNLTANLDQMSAVPALAEGSDDVVLVSLPLFHSYALNAGLGMTIKTGATALLLERFDPEAALDVVERHGATIVLGAPPMYAAWANMGPEAAGKLSSVRLAVSGASSLPPDVLRAFTHRFGMPIWEGYGLTEAAPAVTTNAVGSEAKPGSIGLPLPGLEVRLVDERGEEAEEDDPGEIYVRGPNVFSGYWGKDDATAAVFEGDWLKTGDVAYRDEDDYLHLVDRKKDLIIVSGFNVYPKEVEDAIAQHPKVAEAAVVGIPDDRTGEAVQAWVVPSEGESVAVQEILDFLRGYLARFKWPKEIRIVEELPHHVTGKVLRRFLRGQEALCETEPPS